MRNAKMKKKIFLLLCDNAEEGERVRQRNWFRTGERKTFENLR